MFSTSITHEIHELPTVTVGQVVGVSLDAIDVAVRIIIGSETTRP